MTEIYLYHGTTQSRAEKIMAEGFKLDMRRRVWKKTAGANHGYIYLSSAYAPYYAACAATKKDLPAIIKCGVDERYLRPDEDFIMQALGKNKYTQDELDAAYERADYQLSFNGQLSLDKLGVCAAAPQHVTPLGVQVLPRDIIMYWDTTISLQAFGLLGGYYSDLSNWVYQGKHPRDMGGLMKWFENASREGITISEYLQIR